MGIMPSYQFHPQNTPLMDSFHSSVSRTALHFFRNASSNSSKKHFFCATFVSSDFARKKNPHKKINFPAGPISSRSSWLGNWNLPVSRNGAKRPEPVLSYKNSGEFSGSDTEEGTSTSTGGSTMQRIVDRLKKFGYVDEVVERKENSGGGVEKGSVEDIFNVEEGLLPDTRGGFSEKFPLGDGRSEREVKFPWEKSVLNEQRGSLDSRKSRTLAEMTLPESETTRLRNLALRVKHKGKIGGAGVTQQVVSSIHEKWKSSEVVRLKVEGPPALNMRRMHEILERKTGGLVIWRSGTSVSLYRGVTYVDPALKLKKDIYKRNETSQKSSSAIDKSGQQNSSEPGPKEKTLPEVRYEDEMDGLLDGLGPRYADWPGEGPLPVDADLLPGVVPGYRLPFRLLPYGTRSNLGIREATSLRRLARVLPPHFALGRSRQHQGLAAAMIKLWERSSIVKIALKRGVQLTTSERMAEDLKRLTGGTLVSRNKDFLVFYRGKDFLSPEVAEVLLEKERLTKNLQDEEERARLRTSTALVEQNADNIDESRTAGTLKETLDAKSRWGRQLDDDLKEKVMREAEALRHADLLRKLEKKLAFAEKKLNKGERALSKVEESLHPAGHVEDPESLTDEERFMLRKLGLRMKAFLLLGRRGIFGGTVENMHLHWKYRELVKILVKAPNIEEVKNIALSLEAESGGVLVSVDKVSKGYAIVVFRGRDYKRPQLLRPNNLLTKRKALARSIELQRREAILNHISTVQARVNKLRNEIKQVAAAKDQGDDELYNKLDSAYSSEDEDSEEDENDPYLETYDSENDTGDENNDSVHNAHSETNFPYDFEEDSETESPVPINRLESVGSSCEEFENYDVVTKAD